VFKPRLRKYVVSVRLFVGRASFALSAQKRATSNAKAKTRLQACGFLLYNFLFC